MMYSSMPDSQWYRWFVLLDEVRVNRRYLKWVALVIVVMLTACSAVEKSDVIATVNGRDVTAREFDAYLAFKRIKVRDADHRKALLDQYLQREALSTVIETKYDEKSRELADAELADFKQQMTINRYFEHFLNQAVTDQKIQNYYAANVKRYSDTKVHAAHILFRLKKGMSETERKAKLTSAMEAYSKLKAGETFTKVADDYSEDRISAKKGGDLGWLKKGAIEPGFSDKIYALKKGEITEPFETSFGYHIATVLDEPKTVTRSFESVKGDIRYQLRQEVKQAELDKLNAAIEIRTKQ
jgi:peptidyl-prolyl cis-trans isomerase C